MRSQILFCLLLAAALASVGVAQSQTVDWGSVLTGNSAPPRAAKAERKPKSTSPNKASSPGRSGQSQHSSRKVSPGKSPKAGKGKVAAAQANWPWKESRNLDTLPISDTDKVGINKVRTVLDIAKSGNLAGWFEKAAEHASAGIAIGAVAVLLKFVGKSSAFFIGMIFVGACQIFRAATPTGGGSPRGVVDQRRGLSVGSAIGVFVVGVAVALLIPIRGAATSAEKAKPNFVPVHSKDFAFHIYIPEPIIRERHIEEQRSLKVPYDVVGWNNDDPLRRRELAMAYMVLPSAQDMAKAQGLSTGPNYFTGQQVFYYLDGEKGLDGVVDGLRKKSEISVDNVCSVGLQGKYPGREVEGTITDGSGRIARTRIYLIDNQIVIQLCVAGEPNWVNSNDAYKFFDSLTIDR